MATSFLESPGYAIEKEINAYVINYADILFRVNNPQDKFSRHDLQK